MAVYDEADGKQWIAFHTSPDLKKWTYQSRIEGFFECPDLFELAVEGEKGRTFWVLYGADGKYQLGDFDGKTFKPNGPKKLQLWHGNFYAAQTFSDAPEGRRIQIGWGQGITFPGMPFNQQMTIPCQLVLRNTADGVRLCAWPAPESSSRVEHTKTIVRRDLRLEGDQPVSLDVPAGDLWDVRITFTPGQAKQITFTLRGVPIVYDVKNETLTCRGKSMPLKVRDEITLRVLIDRGSVEIFGPDGQAALVAGGLLPEERTFAVKCNADPANISTIEIAPVLSSWE
jgi:fructan beta-fructosidase